MKRFSIPSPLSVLSAMIIGVCVVAILCPSVLTSGDPATGVAPEHLLPPDSAHWCGTDQLGRDVLTRIIYGARETLPAAFVATMTGIVLGSVIGGFAALSGPAVDTLLSGVIDVLLAIPELLLALTVVILTGFGPVHAALAVGISQTAGFARIVRNLQNFRVFKPGLSQHSDMNMRKSDWCFRHTSGDFLHKLPFQICVVGKLPRFQQCGESLWGTALTLTETCVDGSAVDASVKSRNNSGRKLPFPAWQSS